MNADQETRTESKQTQQTQPEISTLKRREIQAPLLVEMIHAMIDEVGYEKAVEIARVAIERDAVKGGKMMAEKYDGNGVKELSRVLHEGWAEGDALQFTLLEQTDQVLSFDVNRCRYVDLYERLGVKEFGTCLSCSRDPAFIKGFNPGMKLERTQTIMEGAPTCDFRFSIK